MNFIRITTQYRDITININAISSIDWWMKVTKVHMINGEVYTFHDEDKSTYLRIYNKTLEDK